VANGSSPRYSEEANGSRSEYSGVADKSRSVYSGVANESRSRYSVADSGHWPKRFIPLESATVKPPKLRVFPLTSKQVEKRGRSLRNCPSRYGESLAPSSTRLAAGHNSQHYDWKTSMYSMGLLPPEIQSSVAEFVRKLRE